MQTSVSKSPCSPIGRVQLTRINRDGKVMDRREYRNLIVSAGKDLLSSRLIQATDSVAKYLAIGIGTSSAVAGDTSLETQVSRASATCTQSTTTVTNDTAEFEHTFSITSTRSITEAGILNSATGGTLLARRTFSAIACVSGDSLLVKWGIQF